MFKLYLQLDVTVVTHGNKDVTNIDYGTEVCTAYDGLVCCGHRFTTYFEGTL